MTNFVFPLFTGIGTGSLLASIAWYFKMRQRLLNRLYQEKRGVLTRRAPRRKERVSNAATYGRLPVGQLFYAGPEFEELNVSSPC